jgi:uncharacterized protein YggT (Ycf19 family)
MAVCSRSPTAVPDMPTLAPCRRLPGQRRAELQTLTGAPHMDDPKLAADEERRAVQHDAIKSNIESDVNAEIAARAKARDAATAGEIREAAVELRDVAVQEVKESEREIVRGRGAARVSQVVDYIFWLIYAVLGLRFLLGMIGARSDAGFTQFVRAITDPFYFPFRGLVQSPEAPGGYVFEWPILIAICVYALLHWAINGFLRMMAERKTNI